MREMKESGIEWVGQMPSDWELVKIATLYSIRNTKVSDIDYPPLSVTMQGILPQVETAAKTNDHDNRKLVKKGDFAINSRSDRRGSCGISEYDGSVSLINTVLKPNRMMNSRYYNWLFHTPLFADEFYKWGHGIVDDLWTTGWQEMKKITVPFPPAIVQEKIADFLDAKCAEIDALTADIEKQIETLEQYKRSVITEAVTKGLNPDVEMKESGVEWIGAIPSHWNVNKIKYVTSSRNEKRKYSELGRYIGLENVESNTGHFVNTDTEYEDIYYDCCHAGDLLYGKLRPNLAKAIIAPVTACCTGEFEVIQQSSIGLRFLQYYMLTPGFTEIVTGSTYGAKMPRANWEFISNLEIVYPEKYERDAIVSFLDDKCASVDEVLDEKRKQLNSLADYKKSLIYEYVTGKKEVPVA